MNSELPRALKDQFKVLCLVVAIVLAAASPSARAQDLPPTEKVLVPIFFTGTLAGAYGSVWKSELVVTNRSATSIGLGGIYTTCHFDPCVVTPGILPRLPAEGTIVPWPASELVFPPASFLLVESGRVADLALSLRIQDVSRQALTWGTEIPVVPESRAFTAPVDLLNVPVDARFRVLVRLYDFVPAQDHRVRISGYKINPPIRYPGSDLPGFTKVFETERDLVPYGGPGSVADLPQAVPGYAQLDLAEVGPLGTNVTMLRIRVEPIGGTTTYWTFVSVTNNEIQHVTTISPY